MALFRFHRGGLQDSLDTTIIVKSFQHLCAIIADHAAPADKWGASIKIEPYPEEGKNFDPRIGWYTYLVTANIYEKDKMHPIGFLSEPLDNMDLISGKNITL